MKTALALAQDLGTVDIGELLAFSVTTSDSSAKQLSGSSGELVRSIASVLDEMVLGALDKRTGADFRAARDQVFPNYVRATRALSDLVRILIPDQVIERITDEACCEMEADFRDQGLAAFGANIQKQAIFTVWTLRKIAGIAQTIAALKVPENLRRADTELSAQFVVCALWTRFHFDCLIRSMQLNKPLYPEVLEEISDGLRSAVNAYAYIRQGLDMRSPSVDPLLPMVDWDDEERELLESSMRDMNRESI
jgi:hypothetical protein